MDFRLATAVAAGLWMSGAVQAASLTNLSTEVFSSDSLTTGCDWIQGPSVDSKNSGFIDSNADYQIAAIPVSVPEGDEIWIEGDYPLTRYFSFQVYDGNRIGNLLDAAPDSSLVSLDGMTPQANRAAAPYLPANGQRSYLIKVRYQDAPANAADRVPNVLYAGVKSDKLAQAKQLLYRVYLPDSGINALGGRALPKLVYMHAGGGATPLASTPDANKCKLIQSYYGTIHSIPGVGVGVSKPQFKPITSSGLYPNGDSAYLRAAIGKDYSDMAVVRVRVPQYPKIRARSDNTPQARYWSVCQYGLYSTEVVGCVADRETVRDNDGYVTVIISTLDSRPAAANPAQGYNWLPWGTENTALVVLRETLTASNFAGDYQLAVDAAQASNSPPPLDETLGSWAPEISYCDSDTFAAYSPSGGAALFDACAASYKRRLAAAVSLIN